MVGPLEHNHIEFGNIVLMYTTKLASHNKLYVSSLVPVTTGSLSNDHTATGNHVNEFS